ncbi:response regulator [Bacteroidales bacterium OttesenSCG-928-A17]|nr:response regulator [Bacteroidales bacterium OttesenSCG-928-A17]
MKVYRNILIAVLFFTCSLSNSFAFQRYARFDKIAQQDGLSSNHILCIHQEKAGWMWFGTSLGLNRYDGYQIKVFKNDIDGLGTLRGELVRCIYEDDKNQLWVGTELGGLNLFDRNREEFNHFLFEDISIDTLFSVNSITQDINDKIIIGGNQGVAYLDKEHKLIQICIKEWEDAGRPEINKIFVDKKNTLWVGSTRGLFTYDLNEKRSEKKLLPDTAYPSDEINSFFFDSDNILWIGTYNSGVFMANINSGRVQKLDSWVNFNRSETIRAICEDQQGILWFGTRGGLVSYEKENQKYATFLRDENDNLGLSLNSILSLTVDTQGNLWIGTRGGINYRDTDKQAFIHIHDSHNDNRYLNNSEIYCFHFNQNDLLIGTESGGINVYDMKRDRFSYITDKDGLSSNCIKSFAQNGNELFVGTYQGGMCVLDSRTYQMKKTYKHNPSDPHSIGNNVVWCILKDSKNNIWIATNRGVDLFNPQTGKFTHRTDLFPNTTFYWIKEDESGDLWFGGDHSLYIYSPQTGEIRNYPERTRDFIPTLDNRYWLATRGRGLALFEKERGIMLSITEADGLCNNNIQTLLRDKDEYIWISTLNGLSRYDEKEKQFINFDASDGLQDNQFNYGAAIRKDEQLILGGISGITIFNSNEIRKNFFIPPVVFTELRIFNKPVNIGETLEKSISVAKRIELNSKQNVFSIDFTALSFSNSNKNKYNYILEGFDKDWIYAGTTHSATYTNLNPGKYTFKVKGSNSNDVWNPEATSIDIVIHPQFWQTWWFYLLIFVLVILIAFYIIQFYLHRIKLNNKLVFEKTKAKKLHEIEEMKMRFFTNISHEIRTPLTLILGPLAQVMEKNNLDDDSKDKLNLIKRNADQLLKLINQLLDFRKLEAGKLKVHYEKSDLIFYLKSIVDSFNSMAQEKGIKLNYFSEKALFYIWYDTDKIQKIMNNLLSNALKYTNPGGKVTVTFESGDNASWESSDNREFYRITVQDTGIGIPEKNLNKVFNRFEQGSKEKIAKGSGIGLSITQEFIKLMEGDIEVQSKEGEGSSFIVRLPVLMDSDVCNDEETVSGNLEEVVLNNKSQKIILIAEDNADVRQYTASNFKSEYRILEAENGKEAFELACQYIPDIIISDLMMPIMNGDTLCKKIKNDERTSHIPFILLTAVTSKEAEKESLRSGSDDYITKPFDINILKLKVDNLISLRDTLREKYRNDFLLQPSQVTLVSPDEKFLKKAVEVVEKNMDNSDLDIEKFASEVGVSRMQLYRKLEALTNMTVKEFIRDIRIKRAAQLLEQNKLTISEVIYQVGFRDLAYFRKCFREQYGCSPSEYIRQTKEKDKGAE